MAILKQCEECDGNGWYECEQCDGWGLDWDDINCQACEGGGRFHCEDCDGYGNLTPKRIVLIIDGNSNCEWCQGTGWEGCEECDGHNDECGVCDGRGKTTCHCVLEPLKRKLSAITEGKWHAILN